MASTKENELVISCQDAMEKATLVHLLNRLQKERGQPNWAQTIFSLDPQTPDSVPGSFPSFVL